MNTSTRNITTNKQYTSQIQQIKIKEKGEKVGEPGEGRKTTNFSNEIHVKTCPSGGWEVSNLVLYMYTLLNTTW